MLRNEKYCGDVLMQKTCTQDCISKKQIRNVGQLPMYLVQNNHEGIVTREKFYEVQAEFARRNAGRAPSQKLALLQRQVCPHGAAGVLRVRDPIPQMRVGQTGAEIRRVALFQPDRLW